MTTTSNQAGVPIGKVISGGYCIGCGACTAVSNSPVRIVLNHCGKYQAEPGAMFSDSLSSALDQRLAAACPFAGGGPNEDEIGRDLFSSGCELHPQLGYWRDCFIGHVAEEDFRSRGSSGGFVTWLLCELLSSGDIDGVLHVVPSPSRDRESPILFKYGLSSTASDVRNGAKSRYYAVEMSQALAHVREHPGRYLVVGIPCFIKAIRLLARQEPIFADRVHFCVAILCGHLKSVAYLEYLAWQLGISVDDVMSFDFRHKIPANPASNYALRVVHRHDGSERTVTSLMRGLRGEDWGLGLFKYAACDFCDDVMGETADVSAGDAWIEPYNVDPLGTNVIVVRNEFLGEVIQAARSSGRLSLDPVSPDTAAQTQAASFRHRRAGLAYRLWLKDRVGEWAPPKRVAPGWRHLPRKYRRIFKLRSSLVQLSDAGVAEARKGSDFGLYWPQVKAVARRYHRCYHPLWIAIPRKLWRMAMRLAGSGRGGTGQ